MGAIAGLFYPAVARPVDPARVRAMGDAMAHRGPDGAGIWTAPGVGLAHRRLALVDRGGVGQPLVSDDGRWTVVLDGAIDNHRALRAELRALGRAFRTAGDAEVVAQAYAQWGAAMLDRLEGTFAIAVHDAAAQALFLARDRLGAKPLHYVELADGALAFASELKGLLAHPLLRRVPDVRAVEDHLAFGHVPDDSCIVAGVRKLAAGHFLAAGRGRGVPEARRWWDIGGADRARGATAALREELLERLRAGVRARMGEPGVPAGAFLSGDRDESIVVALMAEASRQAVTTCRTGPDDDHRHRAAAVAARFATAHHERVAAADAADAIATLAVTFDEPFADPSALADHRTTALARAHVAVALTGDGADATFGGRLRGQERARALLPRALHAPLGRIWPGPAGDGAEAYARSIGLIPAEVRGSLLSASARAALGGYRAEDRYVAAMRAAPARDAIDRAHHADLTIRLPAAVLTRIDRIGMAAGLELRAPLLDHRLVAFAATLPASLRWRGGKGEWLMLQAMAAHLPREVLHAPGRETAPPVAGWLRGALAGEAAGLGRSRVLKETGWFDMARIGRMAEAHRAGREDHGRALWHLAVLERSLGRLFG